MKILFVGNLELEGIISAPSKVANEIFSRTLRKYKSVYFFTYFQDGNKYSKFQKLFGKQILDNNIIQLGLFPLLLNVLKFRPDILQITSLSVYYLIIFPLLKLFGTKVFYLVHSVNKYTMDRYIVFERILRMKILFSEKISLFFSSKILVLSQKEKEHLLFQYAINPQKIVIIDNGIKSLNIKKSYSFNNEIIKIITVGSFDRKEKGFEYLLKFLEQIELKIELTICYYKKHKKKVFSNNPNLKLVWKEPLNENDLREEFIKSDFFVSLAEYEPFSIALLEAMNSGLLFITTDRVGLTERFNEITKKYVVPFGKWEYAKDLLNELVNLSIEKKQELSLKIVKFSDIFNWDNVIENYFKLYSSTKE